VYQKSPFCKELEAFTKKKKLEKAIDLRKVRFRLKSQGKKELQRRILKRKYQGIQAELEDLPRGINTLIKLHELLAKDEIKIPQQEDQIGWNIPNFSLNHNLHKTFVNKNMKNMKSEIVTEKEVKMKNLDIKPAQVLSSNLVPINENNMYLFRTPDIKLAKSFNFDNSW